MAKFNMLEGLKICKMTMQKNLWWICIWEPTSTFNKFLFAHSTFVALCHLNEFSIGGSYNYVFFKYDKMHLKFC
jgi:hypothetical protein